MSFNDVAYLKIDCDTDATLEPTLDPIFRRTLVFTLGPNLGFSIAENTRRIFELDSIMICMRSMRNRQIKSYRIFLISNIEIFVCQK